MHDNELLTQMERRARLRKVMATMDDEDERKAALPGLLMHAPLFFCALVDIYHDLQLHLRICSMHMKHMHCSLCCVHAQMHCALVMRMQQAQRLLCRQDKRQV